MDTDVELPQAPQDVGLSVRMKGLLCALGVVALLVTGCQLIDGSSDTDIWALSRQNQGYHHDGTRWTRFPTLQGVPMWSLSVADPARAYAAGDNGLHPALGRKKLAHEPVRYP